MPAWASNRPQAARIFARAGAAAGTPPPPSPGNTLLVRAVEQLFKFPPFFKMASANARKMIIERGEKMGLDFASEIAALYQVDWPSEMKQVVDPSLTPPAYYCQPFHAYASGNLCWEAAVEMTVAARSVHSVVFDPQGKRLDPEGDTQLRDSYSRCLQQLLEEGGARGVADVLDVGCATGLSSLALLRAFPSAHVTGVDLSPYMLAVGHHLQRKREAREGRREALTLRHAAAEHTGLPDSCMDLVSVCLVCHELPQKPTREIFKEAFRVLRPGGALAIMEMNPASPVFRRIFSSPFPYVAFKSTEPYLIDYVTLDLHQAIADQGFNQPLQLENSPRHRTVVAIKPVD